MTSRDRKRVTAIKFELRGQNVDDLVDLNRFDDLVALGCFKQDRCP